MNDTFRKEYSSATELKTIADEIKDEAERLEEKFNLLANSREKSIAVTNLEQSIMWAIKSLYKTGLA